MTWICLKTVWTLTAFTQYAAKDASNTEGDYPSIDSFAKTAPWPYNAPMSGTTGTAAASIGKMSRRLTSTNHQQNYDGVRQMRTDEDCSAFGWADGMHLVPGMADRVRSEAPAQDAAGSPPGGIGSAGTETGFNRRTQEGHDANSLAEANRIIGAALEGRPVTEADILWALRQTGEL